MIPSHTRSASDRRRRLVRGSAILGAAALALTACSSGGGGGGGTDATDDAGSGSESGPIKVWIQEDLPDRVAATQAIVDEFTAASGVEVELVAVAEDQFAQLLTSSAAAGDLPDVIGALSLPQVRTLSANELVDTEAVGATLAALDPATFTERAVELTTEGDAAIAIPSESWAQLLFYRTDVFEAAGLDVPDSYDAILEAAAALDSDAVAGFVGANAPGDAFTAQTFEHLALGNGCELVDDAGEVTIGSDECVAALDFYGTLISDYSVPGAQDVDTTRAAYFAGQSAMVIWSTFLLDELAGLRDDALPSCAECAGDPAFLANNTGVVTAISGPDGSEPAQYGEITSWTITAGADAASSQAFVEYMFGDGYEPWLAIAPEGKVPVRQGTAEEPTLFADAWVDMEVGVDRKAPLSEFYDADVLAALSAGPDNMSRWALTQGQGDLLGAIQGEQPVANAVNDVTSGIPAADAAATAADAVKAVAESMP